MATITPVNIGVAPNDGLGDPLRTAFQSINANEAALNAELIATTARSLANESAIAAFGALASLNTVGTAQIDDEAVTLPKLAHIATNSLLGRVTAATGDPEVLTAAQVRTLLNVEDGAAADQSAAEVPFTPNGSIAANNVQAAIQEVRDEAATPPFAIADTTGLQAALDARALVSHTHTLADITDSGTAAAANTGTGLTDVILGNDSRLTDSRTPLAHTHTLADITDSGLLAALDDVDASEIVDGAVGTAALALNAVTLTRLQDIATASILGRVTAATGDPEVLTAAQVRTLLNVEDGAAADQSDAEIETAYNNQVDIVSQAEAEAGTATIARRWTAQRVAQAIAALAGGGTDDQTATEVPFTPDGTIAASNVQAAIVEVRDEAAPLAHTHTLADITDSGALAALSTVGSAQIDANAVTASELADNAVDTAAIVDDAVTRAELGPRSIRTLSASGSLALTDKNGIIRSTAAATLTIDPDGTTAYVTGHQSDLFQAVAGTLTITAGTGVTLNGVSAGSTTIQNQFGAATILKSGANAWDIFGDIAAVA